MWEQLIVLEELSEHNWCNPQGNGLTSLQQALLGLYLAEAVLCSNNYVLVAAVFVLVAVLYCVDA